MVDEVDVASEREQGLRDAALAEMRSRAQEGPSRVWCETCGGVIHHRRRQVVPGCRLCIDCAEIEEARQKINESRQNRRGVA